MFEALQDRFQAIIRNLTGRGVLSEADVDAALREVRLALLEADVNFRVVRVFVDRVRERAVGERITKSLAPGHEVVKIVHEELTRLLGGGTRDLRVADRPPTVVLLAGLQGTGKTTTAGKLALRLRRRGRQPLLVATDLKRPAAVAQLQTVGAQAGVPVFAQPEATDPIAVARAAVEAAAREGQDTVIIDSAGRLHIDDELMAELRAMREAVRPHEVLLVMDAMAGQDAVTVAERFHQRLGLDGLIVTKLDGDARGGAVLSVVEVTGVPVLFAGTGEKLDGLEPFHPDRMASRILGMGDVLTLIERAQEAADREAAAELERKLRRAEFTLEEFRQQLRQVRKMGPLDALLEMIPGLGRQLKAGGGMDERQLARVEAIIDSMTPEERRHPQLIDGSRRRRIARGSGTSIQDVNRLLRQFEEARRLIRQVGEIEKKGRRGRWPFPLP
ncbi:MAG: signal recognition particle protein [Armatimonadota bacterium]|nr:signal recognition particle protein [Armatimonadota bacterium]MDR7498831.1 signal recognition particle protein [Armatimonadota bacterium]MDR7504460.1 signal recognition particle protein [Armatimonadota bacterium]MDR7559613.1 signal recognition particle protein [Armatimonadota bacterium]MDR7573011.1 signal recognition particle protein [Armatimonadota bacterium]